MFKLAEFIFENVEALGPNEYVLSQGNEGVFVFIYRTLRQTPMLGMKQPSLNGAILGMESVLRITVEGKPAAGYKWSLYKGKKRIQMGKTDGNGSSGDIKIDFPHFGLSSYKIAVWRYGRKS